MGLSHNYYRHKLKFSIDKVDIMVIQAVGLLDDLDKELNILGFIFWHSEKKIFNKKFFSKMQKKIKSSYI